MLCSAHVRAESQANECKMARPAGATSRAQAGASAALLVVYRFWWLMCCTASTETTRMKAIMPTTMSTDHHCQEER